MGENYIWIQDSKNKMLMHPIKEELNGKDMTDFKDPNGEYLFRNISNLAKSKGEGFISYVWPKVGESHPVAKVSFIRHFKEWDWIIGSGVYVDDVHTAVAYEKKVLYLAITFATLLCIVFSFYSGLYQIKNVVIPIKKSISSLTHSILGLKKSSGEMQKVGNTISDGAQNQATQIEQTSASMEQIKTTVEFSGKNAAKSSDISKESMIQANNGHEIIEKMALEMKKIDENYRQIMNEIEKSGEEFQKIIQVINEIEDKTTVINDIVFQTKLLSFNASVEAARAGEHGKGFAVVAEEVGNLAGMSGSASNEISGILSRSIENVKSIVSTTNSRVKTLVEQGKTNLEIGMKSVEHSQISLQTILENVKNTDNMVNEVMRAAKEQEIGITEVNSAVIELDKVTRNNLNLAKNSSEISQAVHQEVSNIEKLVIDLGKLIKDDKAA